MSSWGGHAGWISAWAKPWGNVDQYDLLVGIGRGFWRVQVKCAHRAKDGLYYAPSDRRGQGYDKDQIDFLAAHLVDVDVWYILPVEAFVRRKGLHCPGGRGKYEKYREA